MKRFLIGFAVAAFVICAYSLGSLGGSDRLVTPSSNTIGLGHIACGLILILWFGALPRLPFFKRILIYPLLAVPALSLIGSGSRGAALALGGSDFVELIFSSRAAGRCGVPRGAGICGDSVRQYP